MSEPKKTAPKRNKQTTKGEPEVKPVSEQTEEAKSVVKGLMAFSKKYQKEFKQILQGEIFQGTAEVSELAVKIPDETYTYTWSTSIDLDGGMHRASLVGIGYKPAEEIMCSQFESSDHAYIPTGFQVDDHGHVHKNGSYLMLAFKEVIEARRKQLQEMAKVREAEAGENLSSAQSKLAGYRNIQVSSSSGDTPVTVVKQREPEEAYNPIS